MQVQTQHTPDSIKSGTPQPPIQTPEQPTPKRMHPATHMDSSLYDQTKKKVHINIEQSDVLEPNIPSKEGDHLINDEDNVPQIEEQPDVLLNPPMRQKYSHLIPDYEAAGYANDHKLLIRIQNKLDQHLLYLKQHRGKKRGDFFKSIRKNLIQGSHIIVDISMLKQIIFIDPTLYICSRELDGDKNTDLLLDLPPNSDIQVRKTAFKSRLYDYLLDQGAFESNRKGFVRIPQFKFPFDSKIEEDNKKVMMKRLISGEIPEESKGEKKLTLKDMFNKDFKFKQTLYQKILEKENKMKQLAKLPNQSKKLFDKFDALKVLDEVQLIYTSKKICNMFRATLIEKIGRTLNTQDHIVVEIIELICNKGKGYLKRVSHSKGPILQTERTLYGAAREELLAMEV